MSLLLQADDFDRSGSVTPPWTVKTGDTWTLNGYNVIVQGAPSTFRRMVMQQFDPGTRLVATGTLRAYEVEVKVTAPPAFSATEDLYAGITFMSSGANGAASHFEVLWRKIAGGLSTLIFQRRDAAGVVTPMFPFGGVVLPTVAVNETHTIKVRLAMFDPFTASVSAYWDGALTIGSVGISNPGTSMGFNGSFLTATHYAGLVATVPGPADPNGDPLNYLVFDAFRFRDIQATQSPLTTAPALTADPVLSAITVADEDDWVAETLDVQPSYSVALEDQYATAEHRFDGGYVQTVATASARRRRWQLRWNAINSTQRTDLEALEENVGGRRRSFKWTDPETGEEVLVRMTSDLSITLKAPGIWSAGVDVEELRA